MPIFLLALTQLDTFKKNDADPKVVLQQLMEQKNNIDIGLLDTKSNELLRHQTLSREEKLTFLWNLILENQEDPF